MDLILKEQGLINIYETDEGEKLVIARELHFGLGSRRDFSTWIKKRVNDCDLIENQDFIRFTQKVEANNASKIEYYLKLDAAKEVAVMERNDKGKQYRRYLIEVEKKYKQLAFNTHRLSPQLQLLINMEMEQKTIKRELLKTKEDTKIVKEELQNIRDAIVINPREDWRRETNVVLGKICRELNNYKTPKDEVYRSLEKRAKCKLNTRLSNIKVRALSQGMSASKVKKLNFLDVIANDARLKEIYVLIVKEMAVRHRVSF